MFVLMKLSFRLCIALILLGITLPAKAQLFLRRHAHPGELPPAFLLVELPTETSRYHYFMQHNMPDKAAKVKLANKQKVHCMVADFSDNFTFCPVFFFNDSDQDKIKDKQWVNVLRDKNGDLINLPMPILTDTNYFIMYYGLLPSVISNVNSNGATYAAEYNDVSFANLVAVDRNFKRLKNGLPDKARFTAYQLSSVPAKYSVESKDFDIVYKPLAGFYAKTLMHFYIPKQHK